MTEQVIDTIGLETPLPKDTPFQDSDSDSQDESSSKLSAARQHRKQLRGKFTRSITRIQTYIRKGEGDVRKLKRELKEIRKDYEKCSFANGEIIEYCDESEKGRLEQWEADLTNDFYSIEDLLSEHIKAFSKSDQSVQSLTSTPKSKSEQTSRTEQPAPTLRPVPHTPTSQSVQRTNTIQSVLQPDEHASTPESSQQNTPTLSCQSKPRMKKSFDSWIDELTEFEETVHSQRKEEISITEALLRLESNRDIPALKINIFDGNPFEYVEFIQRFRVHIHDKPHLTDEVRMGQLKSHLSAGVNKTLSGLGSSGSMYATALKSLKAEYGSPSRIARAYVTKVTSGPKITDKNDLKELSIDVINAIASLTQLNYFSDINASDNLRKIVERMPNYMIDQWKAKVALIRTSGETPSVTHIDTFLRSKVRAEFDPDFGDVKKTNAVNKPAYLPLKRSVNAAPSHAHNGQRSSFKSCSFCHKEHYLSQCERFRNLDNKDKFTHVTSERLCFSCLARGHNIFKCRNRQHCNENGCQRYHHKLLHSDMPVSSVLDKRAMLPVVRIRFKAPNGRTLYGNALIDSGAGTTVIRKAFAKALGLQGKIEPIDISVVGGRQLSQKYSRRVNFKVSALNGVEEFNIQAHEIDDTIMDVPALDKQWLKSFNYLTDINFSQEEGPVDLILGVQYTHLHADSEYRQGLPYEPLAKHSLLGWYVIGSDKKQCSVNTICQFQESVNLEKFYEFETMGVRAANCQCPKIQISRQDQKAMDIFESTCQKSGDRYQIGLPWKSDANLLPNNYKLAEKRLLSLENSLSKDPAKSELYCQVMKDYVTNEWAVKLSQEEISQPIKPVYYLPHFGVYRPDKVSTPLRIVFDPACQFQGTSLNQFLLKGPCLIGNLFGVLIRFREEPVAIVGDISKMFLQVRLREEDSHVHRFLWRNMDTTRDPDIYRLLRVTFGDKSSPDMASYVMNKIAMVHQNEYPEVAAILQRDRYMDDLIHSCSSQDEAIKRMNDLDKLLETGKFKIKEWYCSASSVKSSQSVNEVSLDGEDDLKTLGLGWNPVMDILKFTVKSVNVSVFTKRIVLSKMSSLFDPLGLASPITIKMRMAMQEIWRHKELKWDDHLSSDFNQLWSILFDEMFSLNNLSYPRCLKPVNAYGQPELHTFCDASLKAFGAVIYIVWTTSNGREVQLVTSKAKVSPLRQSTIPRLELMAVLVGSRLTKTVIDELRTKPVLVNFWSDSHIVLNWIQSESINMKPFVGVRVTEIQSMWELSQFKYLPTDLNPADDLSRGLTIDRMTDRWMSGPEFLKCPQSEWPVQSNMSITMEGDHELKKMKPLFPIVKSSSIQPITDPVKYSSYSKLLRITSYVYRFINNLKSMVSSRRSKSTTPESCQSVSKQSYSVAESSHFLNYLNGPLTPKEINKSEDYWVRIAQTSLVNWEYNFRDLCPYVENEIVRVGGRLRHTSLSYDQRHPVLLPRDHHITKLIVSEVHQETKHAGVERTLAEVRRKFWIAHGRQTVKSIVKSCVICRKLRQSPCETLMADFPSERLKPLSPPFTTTGVDLFGPFMLKYGRNKSIKAWGAIFTCSTTRAIHLEIVQDLSTPSFLFALRRFASQHGWPQTIISDNGSNFTGAEKELSKLFQEGRQHIEEFVVVHKIIWKFITPLSPHQGGFYESLIKQVKKNLHVIIGQQILSWNEMSTVFAEIKSLINSRPLGYLSDDPNDPQPLTPNHFLLGRATTDIPSGPFEETRNLRKRFLFVQSLVSNFWKRFIIEYIPTLMRRSKWLSKGRQLQRDDIVLLIDNSCARGKWNLARVMEVYPGKDGIVRNVLVKTKNSEYKRSIQKCVLILESVDKSCVPPEGCSE